MNAVVSFLTAHPIAFLIVAVALFIVAFLAWYRPGGKSASGGGLVVHPKVREHLEAAATRKTDVRDPTRTIGPTSFAAGNGLNAPVGAQLHPEVVQLDTRVSSLDEALSGRMDRLEKRIAALEEQLESGADANGSGRTHQLYDEARYGAESVRLSDRLPGSTDTVVSEPVLAYGGPSTRGSFGEPEGERVPVEIQGNEVVVSHSYPPEAWLVPQAGGWAALSVNREVPLNSFALDRFSLFFDLGERREGSYETSAPAKVRWDGQRGIPGTRGTAVVR